MNKLLALVSAAVVFAATISANARDVAHRPAKRLLSEATLGMRVGLAIPSGQIDSGTTAGQVFGPSMTNEFFIDIRLGDRLILAPYGGYSMGAPGSMFSCAGSKGDCRLYGVGGGGMLRYTFSRTDGVDAWLGYAFSRQWLSFANGDVAASFAGNDHHASVGADFFVNDFNDTRIGVYLDVAVGKYEQSSINGSSPSADPGLHQWTTLGVQFVY